jgi:hypothetical protein
MWPPVPPAMTSAVGHHARPPRISTRFSWSMRSTTASAIMFIRMAEPP